jgi:hypothetical protein
LSGPRSPDERPSLHRRVVSRLGGSLTDPDGMGQTVPRLHRVEPMGQPQGGGALIRRGELTR